MPIFSKRKNRKLIYTNKRKLYRKLNPEDSNINNYSYEGIPYLTEDLERKESRELKKLINDSLLWKIKNEFEATKFSRLAENYKNKEGIEEAERDIEEIKKTKIEINEDLFPPCIKNILNNKEIEDGRKRSLFILINFFTNIGWDWDKN